MSTVPRTSPLRRATAARLATASAAPKNGIERASLRVIRRCAYLVALVLMFMPMGKQTAFQAEPSRQRLIGE